MGTGGIDLAQLNALKIRVTEIRAYADVLSQGAPRVHAKLDQASRLIEGLEFALENYLSTEEEYQAALQRVNVLLGDAHAMVHGTHRSSVHVNEDGGYDFSDGSEADGFELVGFLLLTIEMPPPLPHTLN
jgi:hypothetical protein